MDNLVDFTNAWTGNMVCEIVDSYIGLIAQDGKTYNSQDLAAEKNANVLQNALEYVTKGQATELYAFIDRSFFENGKSGLAFSREGIFEKSVLTWIYLPYNRIGKMFISDGVFNARFLEFAETAEWSADKRFREGLDVALGFGLDISIMDTYNLEALMACLTELSRVAKFASNLLCTGS